mgnify:CR=1 FL=1
MLCGRKRRKRDTKGGSTIKTATHSDDSISLEHINSGKLLDIGCGNGDFFGLINEKGLELYGIDLAEKYFYKIPVRVIITVTNLQIQ